MVVKDIKTVCGKAAIPKTSENIQKCLILDFYSYNGANIIKREEHECNCCFLTMFIPTTPQQLR